MNFADIHIHALYNTDDGPKTREQMDAIIDRAYADGTRLLCVTPHCHPGFFPQKEEATAQAFAQLQAYAGQKYPDLILLRGSELRYSNGCISWLETGLCRTLGNTHCVLVDFLEDEKGKFILSGIERLFNAGYTPVLAHTERYRNLSLENIGRLHRNGVLIQVDAQALLKKFGLRQWVRGKKILNLHWADFVSSDAHDTQGRPPELSRAYEYVKKKFGENYARNLFWQNAAALLGLEKHSEEKI